MKRFIYIYFGNYRWARRLLGGRWVKDKERGFRWLMWNTSDEMGNFKAPLWPSISNDDRFETEEYL